MKLNKDMKTVYECFERLSKLKRVEAAAKVLVRAYENNNLDEDHFEGIKKILYDKDA